MNKITASSAEKNQIEKELETQDYIISENGRYIQKSNNCFEIACILAEKFGYEHPKSRRELRNLIFASRRRQLWGGETLPTDIPSDACFLIRTPDNPTDAHATFEFNGKEFNYGPSTKEKFPVERRMYLRKKTD